jgi:hypothetical protein
MVHTERRDEMKSLILHADEVLSLLKTGKAKVRRAVKPQPIKPAECELVHRRTHPCAYFDAYNGGPGWCWWTADDRQHNDCGWWVCPLGLPGERRWVKETWREREDEMIGTCIEYGDGARIKPTTWTTEQGWRCEQEAIASGDNPHQRSAVHMPQWASRLTVEVASVRVVKDGPWFWEALVKKVEVQ